jgi:SAM-dependent methyltransferase
MKALRMSRYHASHAGITTGVFSRGTVAPGLSSYDLLADIAQPGERVLDLGCGDGYLLRLLGERGATAIGLDRSPAELALAHRRGAIAVHGDATALPFADASFSLAVSHLAFSIMEPAAAVAAELVRVLTPSSRFAAIVGGGPVATSPDQPNPFEHFLSLLNPALGSIERSRFGDPIAGREDGWRSLFAHHGFSVQWTRHVVDLTAPLDEVWYALSTMYDASLLPEPSRQDLHAAFTTWCRERFDLATIPLHIVLWLAVASRP